MIGLALLLGQYLASGRQARIGQLTAPHADSGAGGLLGGAAAAILLGDAIVGRDRADRAIGRVWIALGVAIALAGLVDLLLLASDGDLGSAERARTLMTSIWLLSLDDWISVTDTAPGRSRPALHSS